MSQRRLSPTNAAVAPKARLLSALGGGRPAILPVAPLYLSLYLAKVRHETYAEEWRRRAELAGGTMGVTFEDELAVQREVWYSGYEVFAEAPDWLTLPIVGSRRPLEGCVVALEDEGACYWTSAAGMRHRLDLPFSDAVSPRWEATDPPRSAEEARARIPVPESRDIEEAGHLELARRLLAEVGETYALCWLTGSPYTAGYAHLGFQGLMLAMREQPEVLLAIAEAQLEVLLAWATAVRNAGVQVVFVEEWACGADLISPEHYRTFAWPFERELCRELRRLGFRTVFYFCGAIDDRLAELSGLEADALAFEESKKGWRVDIGEVRGTAGPERCLFGNLDVVRVRDGDREALRRDVRRQIDAAGSKAFVTSIGSPLTLDTPPHKVDWLIEAAREYES